MKRHQQCETVRRQLPDFLAQTAELPSAISAHLGVCPACAQEWQELRRTWALMDAWQAPEPSPYFDSRLQARLREEQSNPRRAGVFAWLGMRWRPALAAVAALVLVVVLGVVRTDHSPVALAPSQPSAVADLQNLDKNADVYNNFDMLFDDDQQAQPSNQ